MVELNKIYHENCLTFMDLLAREETKIDVVVTSPPYNIKKQYGQYKDNRERKDYLDWIQTIAKSSLPILQDRGSFFLNIGGTPSDPLFPLEVAQRFLDAGYVLQNTIHWIKSISFEKDDVGKSHNLAENRTFGSTAIGHFKPIVSERFLTDCHEYIFHLTKHGDVKLDKLAVGVPYQDKNNIGRWKSAKQDRRDRGNTWFIPYPTINESRPHPAVFPCFYCALATLQTYTDARIPSGQKGVVQVLQHMRQEDPAYVHQMRPLLLLPSDERYSRHPACSIGLTSAVVPTMV